MSVPDSNVLLHWTRLNRVAPPLANPPGCSRNDSYVLRTSAMSLDGKPHTDPADVPLRDLSLCGTDAYRPASRNHALPPRATPNLTPIAPLPNHPTTTVSNNHASPTTVPPHQPAPHHPTHRPPLPDDLQAAHAEIAQLTHSLATAHAQRDQDARAHAHALSDLSAQLADLMQLLRSCRCGAAPASSVQPDVPVASHIAPSQHHPTAVDPTPPATTHDLQPYPTHPGTQHHHMRLPVPLALPVRQSFIRHAAAPTRPSVVAEDSFDHESADMQQQDKLDVLTPKANATTAPAPPSHPRAAVAMHPSDPTAIIVKTAATTTTAAPTTPVPPTYQPRSGGGLSARIAAAAAAAVQRKTVRHGGTGVLGEGEAQDVASKGVRQDVATPSPFARHSSVMSMSSGYGPGRM